MKKSGVPNRNELVICKILKIYPNSVLAELVEYKKNGMIHVSEVASRWVRDIREFLKENQYVVCRVMNVEGDHIHLSVKRVAREQAAGKLNEFKRESKTEKMLELAAKSINKTLDQAYEEVGFKLQDEFGSLTKAFEIALKNPALMKTKGIPSEWIKPIMETAKKSYVEKTYRVKSNLSLISYSPDGVDVIKKSLSLAGKNGLSVKYISAPNYVLSGEGKNYKELDSKIIKISENIVKEIQKSNGEASFELEE